jgi:hypothetical protein
MTAPARHPVDRFLAEISAGRGITTGAWTDGDGLDTGPIQPPLRGGRGSATLLAEMEADRVH